MTIRKIVTYPAKVLREIAKPVKSITQEVSSVLDDMTDIMYAANGVGLAAPQVGVGLRLIVVDAGIERPDGTIETNLYQFINPEIISSEGETEIEEGCLSCPDFRLTVKRSAKIHVRALDKNGTEMELHAEGLLAIIIQHEVDHLNGITLLDKVSKLKRDLYLKERKKKSGQ